MTVSRLHGDEITDALKRIDCWVLDREAVSIQRSWKFIDFRTAMNFIQKVAEIAERHDHHPEFLATYTNVQIRLSTHDVNGLTEKDIALAVEIDQLITTVIPNEPKNK